jgi:hypothetical protein
VPTNQSQPSHHHPNPHPLRLTQQHQHNSPPLLSLGLPSGCLETAVSVLPLPAPPCAKHPLLGRRELLVTSGGHNLFSTSLQMQLLTNRPSPTRRLGMVQTSHPLQMGCDSKRVNHCLRLPNCTCDQYTPTTPGEP